MLNDKETKLLFDKFGLECNLNAPSEDSVSATHFDLLKGHPLVIELIANICRKIPDHGSLNTMCTEIR